MRAALQGIAVFGFVALLILTAHDRVYADYTYPCPPPPTGYFHRGDANASGALDLSDAIYELSYLFLGGPAPSCLEAADADNADGINISDGILILSCLFADGTPPVLPGPPDQSCGPDFDEPGTPGDLGWSSYPPCAAPPPAG